MPRRRIDLGILELVLAGATVAGVCALVWADSDVGCDALESDADALEDRDEALSGFLDQRCAEGRCDQIEVVSTRACLAKVRYRERRVDEYGDTLGTFVVVEGLVFSPLLERWRHRETLEDKQVLGLPLH